MLESVERLRSSGADVTIGPLSGLDHVDKLGASDAARHRRLVPRWAIAGGLAARNDTP